MGLRTVSCGPCCDMSLDEYHGHSQVTLTGQPGRSTGLERLGFFGDTPRHKSDHGPRYYKPDHGPYYEPDRQLRHRAAGPSGQWPPVLILLYGWTRRPRAPGAGAVSRPLHG